MDNQEFVVQKAWVAKGCGSVTEKPHTSEDECMRAIFRHEEQRGHEECSEPVRSGYIVKCKTCKRLAHRPSQRPQDPKAVNAVMAAHECSPGLLDKADRRRRESELLDQALGFDTSR
jgi:hypothetical protein